MKLVIDAGITRLDVVAHGRELASLMGRDKGEDGARVYTWPDSEEQRVASIADPVLMTDHHQIGILGETDPVVRDTVAALYGSRTRITRYDDTEIHFDQSRYPGVWGPSIDTILFCRALSKMELGPIKTSIEVGAGSGFITKYLLKHDPTLERATMVDMMPAAIRACQDAIEDPRARYYTGDGMEFLEHARADLVISNPPYIPRPQSIDDNPYEGVDLMVGMIQHAETFLNPGGKLLLNYSDLCADIADAAISKAGLSQRVVDSMRVPLKVFNVLNNEEWLRFLVEEKGMKAERHRGYDYWHTIKVVAIERQTPAS